MVILQIKITTKQYIIMYSPDIIYAVVVSICI